MVFLVFLNVRVVDNSCSLAHRQWPGALGGQAAGQSAERSRSWEYVKEICVSILFTLRLILPRERHLDLVMRKELEVSL